MGATSELAVLGGRPVLTSAPPFVWPPIGEEDVGVVADMTRRGELSYYGREAQVQELEEKFKAYLGIGHALATSSGTTALHSAFFALGLQPGDEVLAPTYTFLATVMPLFVANAVPVLVDTDADTGNIDPADLESRITQRTRAIVVTHMWGNPVPMRPVLEIARRHGLSVVEDCSHAHGATCDGQFVGTFGDVAVFSLQGKKLVAAGQGGVLVTDNDEMFERAVLLGHFNVRAFQDVHSVEYRAYAYAGLGLNYRMHPLAAAIANRQMDRLEEYIAGRRRNLEYLSSQLDKIAGVHPPVIGSHVTRHVYYGYKPTYHAEELGGLPIEVYLTALQAEGVPVQRYDTSPLHLLPIFGADPPPLRTHGVPETFVAGGRRRTYRSGDLPNSERHAAHLISLDPYTEPMDETLDAFAEAFSKIAEHADELLAHTDELRAHTDEVLAHAATIGSDR